MKKILSIAIIILIVLPVISVFIPQAKAESSSLVGYWKFDEGSGTVAGDSSGNGNTGALMNGPQWVDGISGKALKFDGTDDYLSASDSPSLDVSGNQITVMFWMRPTVDIDASTLYQKLYDKGDAYHSAIGGGGMKFSIAYVHDIDSVRKTWSGGTWYHIAHVYNGSTISIYVNGVLDNSEPETGNIRVTSLPFTIAAYTFGGKWFFPGTIDEFRIYSLALSPEEISDDYTESATTLKVNVFDESGLPPPSTLGARSLSDIPVEVYTLDGSLVASGVTDSAGTISFNLPENNYKIVYGGKVIGPSGGAGYGVTSQIVDVSGVLTEVDLYCFQVTYHSYEAGGPYELDYIDLDTGSVGYQDIKIVQPGELVDAEFSWWELETRNVPVWYVSAFGDWSPTSALGNLGSGTASPSSHELHTVPLIFIAPTEPGTYEVRLVGVLDFDWAISYYTAAHYNPSLGRDMGIVVISEGVEGAYGIGTIIVSGEIDNEPPVIQNVRHEPLYPMEDDEIFFYADVTDNVAVASVQLNYTLDGGATWLLKDMSLLEGDTYSTSLDSFNQFQIIGFYVIAYDTSGNKAIGSEIVPPLPEPPRVAPIVVSDEPSNPLPDGEDVSYNVTETGVEVYGNMSELGLGPGPYTIIYSLDGGITWIHGGMAYVGGFVWSYVIPAFTNILFRVEASDGSSSILYWIIVGPWKYEIYLYFSTEEQYYPVKGLDFDGDDAIDNNAYSYLEEPDSYIDELKNNDADGDDVPDVWSYAYMNPKTLDDGCLVIEYWIYYAYNDYQFIFQHEHDFESIFLWIDIATGDIKKIALSQNEWVNHYEVNAPHTRRLNIAVERGGHGMSLLSDEDGDGLPDEIGEGLWPEAYKHVTPTDHTWYGHPPFFIERWNHNEDSFCAQLHPWVIYDPRKKPEELHLFGNSSILTEGLDSHFIIPFYFIRKPDGWIDIGATQWAMNYLIGLIGSKTLLKTSIAMELPLPTPLPTFIYIAFMVSAPWHRLELAEAGRQWKRINFEFWITKKLVSLAITIVSHGLTSAVESAIAVGIIHVAPFVLDGVVEAFFDPIKCSIMDTEGRIIGYTDDGMAQQLPGGFIMKTRNMTYGLYDLFLILTGSPNIYTYEVRGEEPSDVYNFTASYIDIDGNILNFNATGIPINAGEVHRYVINWTLLEKQELGVEVYVDQDGDGTFEGEFLSDGELTGDEFKLLPIASFTESIHIAPAGTTIYFNPIDSYDPDGAITLFEWDFDGDGIYDVSTSTADIVSYTYTTPGEYTVTLRVTDNDGLTDTVADTKTITPIGVIPEVPIGTILASAAMIIAFVAYFAVPKWRRKRRNMIG